MGAFEHVAAVVDIGEGNLLFPAAMQDDLSVLLTQLLKGGVYIESVVLGQGCEHVEVVHIASIPAADGALSQAGLREQHDAAFIEILFYTQPVAPAAGTGRVVEGEQARFKFVDAVATLGAGEACREADIFTIAVHIAD